MHQIPVFLAACAGGAINPVAGGGTLLTVPTLIWLGVPALNANATSTVARWPGSLSGAWGFRREMRQADPRVYALVVPSTNLILWENALPMAVGAIVSALIGSGTARRVGQTAVRYLVVGVGLAMAVSMFLRL